MSVVFGIQHAMRMRRAVLPSVACLAVLDFFHIISKTARFSIKRVTELKCVLIFSTNLAETFIILRNTELDTITKVHTSSCKILVILLRF